MDTILSLMSLDALFAALAVALVAGVVKGLVGFGMPMILVSGLGNFLAPELALAGLIVPTLVTNGMQALRQGPAQAAKSMQKFRVFLGAGLITLLISAQFVRVLPTDIMLLIIGVLVAGFAIMQLVGLRFHLQKPSKRLELGIGGFAGLIGGVSGVWGPPTVAYLTALNTEKTEQMRVQGVIYGLGAVALAVAHIGSGVLNGDTVVFSVMLVPSAILGMWVGGTVQDRIDQTAFRKATLIVLALAAANLIRKALLA